MQDMERGRRALREDSVDVCAVSMLVCAVSVLSWVLTVLLATLTAVLSEFIFDTFDAKLTAVAATVAWSDVTDGIVAPLTEYASVLIDAFVDVRSVRTPAAVMFTELMLTRMLVLRAPAADDVDPDNVVIWLCTVVFSEAIVAVIEDLVVTIVVDVAVESASVTCVLEELPTSVYDFAPAAELAVVAAVFVCAALSIVPTCVDAYASETD